MKYEDMTYVDSRLKINTNIAYIDLGLEINSYNLYENFEDN